MQPLAIGEDERNIYYGGKDQKTGWAQILRLDKPDVNWEVDLELGPNYLRPEILKSITFTLDKNGKLLKESVQFLIVGAYDGNGSKNITFFIRDDDNGKWERSRIISTGNKGEDNSIRCAQVYRDRKTGLERLFISIGVSGIFSGVYDPEVQGKILWDKLGMAELKRGFLRLQKRIILFCSPEEHIFIKEMMVSRQHIHRFWIWGEIKDRKSFSAVGGISSRAYNYPKSEWPRRIHLIQWLPGKESKGKFSD